MREIVIACGDYDRTTALRRHTLALDGTPYHYVTLTPAEIFWRMHQYEEFDACEYSFGTYCTSRGRGDDRFVALPAFPSRSFRHGNVYVREDSPIEHPSQLAGCRIGAAEYEQTAGVWIRGFLQDDYGVHARDCEWVLGRQAKNPGIPYDPAIKVTAQGDVDLDELLVQGEIDALTSAGLHPRLGRGVRRLFPDYQAVEQDYFRRTGIFPVMHILVLKRSTYEQYPHVARSLYKGFCEAKAAAQRYMYRATALCYTLPWLIPHIEETRALMGSDPWPYGIQENEPTLKAFVRHLVDQALLREPLPLDQLFLPGQWTNQLT